VRAAPEECAPSLPCGYIRMRIRSGQARSMRARPPGGVR
jgi:hypothetical protein